MDDRQIMHRIHQLVDEEHALERTGRTLTAVEQRRLSALEIQLDQAWDLLRQRRARRRVGLDPDEAMERPLEMVEYYQQ
jgi:hypothetical protein